MSIELKTRIALKYDSYSDWQNSDLVLLPGEVAFCEIPGTTHTAVDENGKTVNVTTAPTVLFKVGNEAGKKFSELPWASAKAADVYTWAKASAVTLSDDTKTITFVGGNENGEDKVFNLDFYTTQEVDEALSSITSRLDDVEASLGLGEGATSLTSRVEAVEDKLVGIGTTVAAAIEASEADTKTAYEAYADQAETDAITAATNYANGLKATIDEKDAAQDEAIGANSQAISDEATARDNADKAIEAKIGGNFDSTNTVAKAITAAENTAKAYADTEIAALSEPNGAIAVVKKDLTDETEARVAADNAITKRLDTFQVFFDAADADGEDTEGGKTLYDALDTLKEIQDFISNEATAADEMLQAISNNTEAIGINAGNIDALETTVGDDKSGLVKDVNTAKEEISALNIAVGIGDNQSGLLKDVTELKEVTITGDNANTKLRNAITELQGIVKTGADNNAALGVEIDEVSAKVNNSESGLAATKAIADKNKEDITALTAAGFIKLSDFLNGEFIFECGSASSVVHTDTAIPAETQG